jgi:hypothetical protein
MNVNSFTTQDKAVPRASFSPAFFACNRAGKIIRNQCRKQEHSPPGVSIGNRSRRKAFLELVANKNGK